MPIIAKIIVFSAWEWVKENEIKRAREGGAKP